MSIHRYHQHCIISWGMGMAYVEPLIDQARR
ncbi:hypothetical protein DFO68_101254 [Halomonas ventosae]|uniref:Uncharacterized protein n=1 Tax=Halomonas ventosae TaxID=229007 RepID=A0A4R6I3Z3_9GAMM|nr:hypothetical protein DFO68_101254 [Halomonas ventosae]